MFPFGYPKGSSHSLTKVYGGRQSSGDLLQCHSFLYEAWKMLGMDAFPPPLHFFFLLLLEACWGSSLLLF
ncbi:hypothetical protein BT69DRAFT_12363 [Atractiella rhizophila]|nr:hypothetical protein BT69DRAFT_12363 [Atractiella rhizophila]